MKYFSILLFGLLFSSAVNAVPEIKDIPGYEVEILVFKNLEFDDQDNELWTQDIKEKNRPDLENSSPVGGGIPANSEIRNAFEKMHESGKYMLVSHKRWVQDAVPKDEAQLIRIANAEARLDGTLQFYKDRFLHLDVNIMLSEEFVPVTTDSASGNSISQENSQNLFIIKEHRKIRSKKINFFDHPRFGILIQVNQLKVSTH